MPLFTSGLLPPLTLLLTFLLVGLVLGRVKVFSSHFNHGLHFLVLKVTLPCLLIASMQRPFTSQWATMAFWSWGVSFALYVGLFLLSGALLRWTKLEPSAKAIYRFAMIFSNVGFMGFPLMEALWGRDAVFLGALFNINFNLFVFSLGTWVLTRHRGGLPGATKEIFLNPGFLATGLGLGLFLGSVSLPPILLGTVDAFGRLTTPLSMLLIGSILAGTSLRAAWRSGGLWLLSGVRLLAIPAVVGVGVWMCSVPTPVAHLAVLVSAMPAAANTTLLAQEYQVDPQLAGQVVLVTTVLSAVSIPAVVILLGLQ